ncbi:HAD-IA family hydrolase [uncultured Pseudokineococcus sp.]|uniref:HAD-IA family hydrolase n=1 Tax=uncultured Pseudokineococcus sp. TaxID=1642928 RepID=UPI002613788B|nr:HAD-IA family hydrolase [uncultured Pseudokineococcus sp.]
MPSATPSSPTPTSSPRAEPGPGAPSAGTRGAAAPGAVLHPGRAPFAAVLFDMDGTLIDSTPSVERCWTRWAGEMGVDPARLLGWHGVPARAIVAALVAPERVAEGVALIDRLEVEDTAGILPLPGAAEALGLLPAGRAAVATSCTRPLALARIAEAALAVPEVVVTADDVERGKPDPEPFLLAAERLGVDPARCLVVEDAPAGLAAARAAGCATLAVTTTTPADALDADVVVPDLGHVRLVVDDDGVRVLAAGEER